MITRICIKLNLVTPHTLSARERAHAHTHTLASAVLSVLENTFCGMPDQHKTNASEHNLQSKGQKSQRARFAEHGGWDNKWNMGLH